MHYEYLEAISIVIECNKNVTTVLRTPLERRSNAVLFCCKSGYKAADPSICISLRRATMQYGLICAKCDGGNIGKK